MSSRGAELIAAERERQQSEEGYTKGTDARYNGSGELAIAGACYALPLLERDLIGGTYTPRRWPWNTAYWKPTPGDRVRELVKAGALIAAAIDVELAKR